MGLQHLAPIFSSFSIWLREGGGGERGWCKDDQGLKDPCRGEGAVHNVQEHHYHQTYQQI
jgi:hypothetical protein